MKFLTRETPAIPPLKLPTALLCFTVFIIRLDVDSMCGCTRMSNALVAGRRGKGAPAGPDRKKRALGKGSGTGERDLGGLETGAVENGLWYVDMGLGFVIKGVD